MTWRIDASGIKAEAIESVRKEKANPTGLERGSFESAQAFAVKALEGTPDGSSVGCSIVGNTDERGTMVQISISAEYPPK